MSILRAMWGQGIIGSTGCRCGRCRFCLGNTGLNPILVSCNKIQGKLLDRISLCVLQSDSWQAFDP